MFISEQNGWVSELSGPYWDAMLDYGFVAYNAVPFKEGFFDSMRDVDLMLMGL